MAQNVIVTDGRDQVNETAVPVVVPIGASYTTQDSALNSRNGGSGMIIDVANEIVVRVTVTGTMPAGTEVVITPTMAGGFPDLADITLTMPTVTDGVAEIRLNGNDNFRDTDLINATYRFIQGAALYTVTSINLQTKTNSSGILSAISVLLTSTLAILTDVWNTVSSALRTEEIDPLSQHYEAETPVVDDTNEAAGTYRAEFSMKGFKSGSIQWALSGGVTMTVWSTNNPAADLTADTGWADVTTKVTGAVSQVDSAGMGFMDTNFMCSRIMIKRVLTDATNVSQVHTHRGY